MLKVNLLKDLPFKGGKYNIAPDDEACLDCGKCCTKYEATHLLPEDFLEEDMEKELRQLMDMDLLFIGLRFHGFEVCLYQGKGNCPLLLKDGCVLTADRRPAGCRYFGPTTDKWGMKRANTEIGCVSKIYKQKPIEKWKKYRDILSMLYDELGNDFKEMTWG